MSRSYPYQVSNITLGNKALRGLWTFVWLFFYRPSPRPFHAWRRFLLRAFGARIAAGARPYPSAKIWAPWNLSMAEYSCLGDDVDCYCVAPISLGSHATVSQYSYLCSASRDYRDPALPLVIAPIVIEREAWVAADVFIGPGVKVHEGAIVGARSTVLSDVLAWTVVAGSPALQRAMRPKFERNHE